MSPTNTSGIGCLIVREHDSVISLNAVKVCGLSFDEGLSLKAIMELLQPHRYHCYKFNEFGTGCKNWVDAVLVLLCHNHIMTENETEHARAALRKAWGEDSKLLPAANQSGIDRGEFY